MQNSQYTIRGLFVTTGIAAVLLGCTVYMWPSDPFSGRKFDRNLWAEFANDWIDDNPRGAMVQDIQKQHLKAGMSKADVIELLGEPETVQQNGDFSYIVGMWSGYRMDHDCLLYTSPSPRD